jgi:hypothetical protein
MLLKKIKAEHNKLLERTINAYLKDLNLRFDENGFLMRGETAIFSSESKELILAFLEGYKSRDDLTR